MKLKLVEEVDKSQLMAATVEWLKEKYAEMNTALFDGKLQDCEFEIFTTGRGMEGRYLGFFKKDNPYLRYEKRTGHLFVRDIGGEKKYVNYDNFVELCKPKILINGNYRWTEKALLSTLVHEMCHYYTNRNGYRPTQSHGTEFKNIAYIVSRKSNGIFTVERIASAEQMDEMDLVPDIKKKVEKRKANKLEKIIVTLVYLLNGEIRLINANGMGVVDMILKSEKERSNQRVDKIKISTDTELKELIYNSGYESASKTYRYWDISRNTALLDKINQYEFKTIYSRKV